MRYSGYFSNRVQLFIFLLLISSPDVFNFSLNAQSVDTLAAWWPQDYSVRLDREKNILHLKTPYYSVEQAVASGGNISGISYINGKAKNLLRAPVGVRINTADGNEYTDLINATATISFVNSGKSVRVVTDCNLRTKNEEASTVILKTIYEYRWGYIRVRRELMFQDSLRVKKISLISMRLAPELSDYGYKPGITEQDNSLPFGFNVIKWRKQRSGTHLDLPLNTGSIPEYLVFLNQGVEGIEWFMSDNAWQWDYQLTGRPGTGLCSVAGSYLPPGIDVSICPVNLPEGEVTLKGRYTFDYYLGLSVLPGKADNVWLHSVISRSGNDWTSGDQIRAMAKSGIRTISYQDDGDVDNDGIYWKDGIYPPYIPEDMDRLDKVLDMCQQNRIKTSAYFSIKEFHPSAAAFKDSAEIWARKYNDKNELKYSYSGTGKIYGVEMCLKSGWKDYFMTYVDKILSAHKFDGIYYDWNLPLYCNNPVHTGDFHASEIEKGLGVMKISPSGHRDIDELLGLMEWTRQRVGPDGLVIIHNTMTPMLATENFANYVVAMEWGYGKLAEEIHPLSELPPEWNFAGSRPRGIIGTGTLYPGSPERLRKKLTIEAMLTGITPWPVMPEAVELYQKLLPLGDLRQYKFIGWNNKIVNLNDTLCAAAIYSKPDTAYLVIGNLGNKTSDLILRLNPDSLPFPIRKIRSARLQSSSGKTILNAGLILSRGIKVTVPPAGDILIRITGIR